MKQHLPKQIYNDFIRLHILDVFWLARKLKNIQHAQEYIPSQVLMNLSKNQQVLPCYKYFVQFMQFLDDYLPDNGFLYYRVGALIDAKKVLQETRLNKQNSTDHVNPERSISFFLFPLESFHIGDFLYKVIIFII